MSGLSIHSISQSLASAHQVQRTQASLANSLTQLSTGNRINSAQDDPAGLIAQEWLRSEITASHAALKNTRMANSMLNVAESGMRQISNLLIEAKGLAVEAANTGAMTPQMVEANQVQMNVILDSIDRFSSMTNWLGKPLLDGTLSSENGGALFQLGQDVVSSQQVSVPIESTQTSRVGGVAGSVGSAGNNAAATNGTNFLMELRSGGAASLATNPQLADRILGAAISQIAVQRGEIGSVQKYTLDSNINTLQDSLVSVTSAKSTISDTDYAVAVSNSVRDQILLQSGIQALGLINQNRYNTISLLNS
jgi:flagellin